jgi:hypothetical protein
MRRVKRGWEIVCEVRRNLFFQKRSQAWPFGRQEAIGLRIIRRQRDWRRVEWEVEEGMDEGS